METTYTWKATAEGGTGTVRVEDSGVPGDGVDIDLSPTALHRYTVVRNTLERGRMCICGHSRL